MKTTADFLDAFRIKFDVDSDFKAMAALGIKHRQQISRYRTLQTTFDDDLAMRIADILETDPAFVVACMHHQRAKHQAEKNLWERIAGLTAGIAAVLIGVAILPYPLHLDSLQLLPASFVESPGLYIM